jgi:membrane protein DedA with SNARE-associated domain
MNLWLALASGILGSLAGAWINYVIALRVGRWVFVRYGRWVFLSEASLARAERYFAAHGEITTFVGRLLPAIRQLISIPAGLARMHLGRFFLFTALGSGLWCAVLLAVGWLIGRAGADPRSRDVVERYSHQALLIVAPVLLLILVVYVVRHRRREGAGTGRQAPGEETRA